MLHLEGCQLPGVSKFSVGSIEIREDSAVRRFKRLLALPWNHYAKRWLKQVYYFSLRWRDGSSTQRAARDFLPAISFKSGDFVRVRTREEIDCTLDPFKELKGCAFLPEMYQYCGTQQRVLKSMQRFMDERDYKLKKTHGVILLEGVICNGTPVFGACDRCCFLFWREEWLEKVVED